MYTRAQAAIDTDIRLTNIADPTRTDDTTTTTSENVNDRTSEPATAQVTRVELAEQLAAAHRSVANLRRNRDETPKPNSAHDHRNLDRDPGFDWQTYEQDTNPHDWDDDRTR